MCTPTFTSYAKTTTAWVFLLLLYSQDSSAFSSPAKKTRLIIGSKASGGTTGPDEPKWTPLLSVPIPGSKTATLQIPGPGQARALLELAISEAQSVGVRNGVERSLQAQRALASVVREGLTSGELQETLRSVSVVFGSEVADSNSKASSLFGGLVPGLTRSEDDDTSKRTAEEARLRLAATPPRLLRQLFQELGATYVKLGQFIASSPTIFPPEYVLEFQQCLDRSSTVPFSTVRAIVEAELGATLEELFESVDPTPLASASIAQVHTAVLKRSVDDGDGGSSATAREVVLKVRKPGVEATLRTDLALLTVAANLVEALAPEASRLSVASIASDLRNSMVGELDLRTEAERLLVFRQFLEDEELTHLATCPQPIQELCSESVLTMTRLRGAPLLSADDENNGDNGGGKNNEDKKEARDGSGEEMMDKEDPSAPSRGESALVGALTVWCVSVRKCDFFHADVHGGNFLLLDDDDDDDGGDARVGFIDFGIVGTLPPAMWGAMGVMADGLAKGDMVSLAESLVSMGVAPPQSNQAEVDVTALARDLAAVMESLDRAQNASPQDDAGGGQDSAVGVGPSAAADVAGLALEVVGAAERNGLVLPREFGLLVKQGLYFDRYLKSLAPDLNPFTDPRVASAIFASPPDHTPSS